MRNILLTTIIIICSCTTSTKRPIQGNSTFQKELNKIFKDASKSPLTKADLKHFKGLDFFPIDSNFIVTAYVEKNSNEDFFDFPTTTNRTIRYKKYATINFKLDNTTQSLNIYQSEDNKEELFLPFLDKTNQEETYSGGRYINLKTSQIKNKTIIIDFNKAYNPYCAYNKNYSCPITPRENYINFEIKSGVKKYKKL